MLASSHFLKVLQAFGIFLVGHIVPQIIVFRRRRGIVSGEDSKNFRDSLAVIVPDSLMNFSASFVEKNFYDTSSSLH
jgi:hypothetical protein